MSRREPKVARFMAYPPRAKAAADSAVMDAALVGWAVFLLLVCYWASGARIA